LASFLSRLAEALFLSAKSLTHWQVLGANALVLDEAGQVLLVRHRYQPGWRLPGGGVDIGETPLEAVKRELAEELGLEGGRHVLAGIYTRRLFWMGHTVVLYRAEGMTGTLRPNWELAAVTWADPAAPPDGVTPATARRLAELRGAPVSDRW
jgi:8-oxo-dGTP pyrophosphatase MutT (NUDIX family)